MKYDSAKHHRRSIRLKGYDYSQTGMYFVTIVAQRKACLFGEVVEEHVQLNPSGEMVEKWWTELEHKFPNVVAGEYIVMPNHFHGVVVLRDQSDEIALGGHATGGHATGGHATGGHAGPPLRNDPESDEIAMGGHAGGHTTGRHTGPPLRTDPQPDEIATGRHTGPPLRNDPELDENAMGGHVGPPLQNGPPLRNDPQPDGHVGVDLCVDPKPRVDPHPGGNAGGHALAQDSQDWAGPPLRTDPEPDEIVGVDLCVDPQPGGHAGPPLPTVVQWFKTMTTNEYIRGVKQLGWEPFDGKLWQRNYYEHIIRSEGELQRINGYIRANPANWPRDDENPENPAGDQFPA